MKRVGFLFLLLLATAPVFGEAFKNDSGSIGGIFLALFVLGIGGPVAVGLGVYALLRLSDDEYTANKAFTVFASCAGWWAMLFLTIRAHSQEGSGLFVLVLISAVAAGAAYYMTRQPKYHS